MWLIAWLLLWNQVSGLSITFSPVRFGLERGSHEEMNTFFVSLLRTRAYGVMSSFLEAKSVDYSAIYCDIWAKYGSIDLIKVINRAHKRGNLSKEQLSTVLDPKCIIKARQLCLDLTPKDVKTLLPRSLMEAPDFRASFFSVETFDAILSQALSKHIRSRRMRWSDWLADENLSETLHLQRNWNSFFERYGWFFLTPVAFAMASDKLRDLMLYWLLPDAMSLVKCTEFEYILRRLTFLACRKEVTGKVSLSSLHGGFYDAMRKLDSRFQSHLEHSSLPFNMNENRKRAFTSTTLMQFIKYLKENLPKHLRVQNHLPGDWFVGVLELWRDELDRLTEAEFFECFDYVIWTLKPTFSGICKLVDMLDESKYFAVFEQILLTRSRRNSFVRELLQECPCALSIVNLPLNMRWSLKARSLRKFPEEMTEFYNLQFFARDFHLQRPPEYLQFIAELMPHASRSAPKYAPISKLLRWPVLFRDFVKRALEVMLSMPWFTRLYDSTLMPNARMPRYYAELLGYLLVQAKLLGVKHFINLSPEFINPSPLRTFSPLPEFENVNMEMSEGSVDSENAVMSEQQSPSVMSLSPLSSSSTSGGFDCASLNDFRLLSANFDNYFSVLALHPDLILYLPTSPLSFARCEVMVAEYMELLRKAFLVGVERILGSEWTENKQELQLILESK